MRHHKVVHGWQIALVSATVIKLYTFTKCFIKNYKCGDCCAQSHYIEVTQGDIFMEQKM